MSRGIKGMLTSTGWLELVTSLVNGTIKNTLYTHAHSDTHTHMKNGILNLEGGAKKINKVWERIGRTKQKHNRVSANYHIEVEENLEVVKEWLHKMVNQMERLTIKSITGTIII